MPTSIVTAFKKAYSKEKNTLNRFLKKFDTQKVVRINPYVQKASQETWAETNCLECGHCCRSMTPTFRPSDVKRIAKHLQITEQEFVKTYTKIDSDSGETVSRKQPCMLYDKATHKCTIYEVRPKDCADFPHFKLTPFDQYNHVHQQNMAYCPAVFRFVQKMKYMIERDYTW